MLFGSALHPGWRPHRLEVVFGRVGVREPGNAAGDGRGGGAVLDGHHHRVAAAGRALVEALPEEDPACAQKTAGRDVSGLGVPER